MPSIFTLYEKYKVRLKDMTVIRLLGPARKEIEKKTGTHWNRIVAPKDGDITLLVCMLSDINDRGLESFVFVNNHFEGSAPRTIQRIKESINSSCNFPSF